MGDIYTNPPQSRNEAIINATINGTPYTAPPQSRMEDLLIQLKEVIEHGEAKIKIGDVQGATASTSLRTVTLTWSDPSDLVLDGVILAKWAGTKVVRKAGSAPADNTDGTVVIDNTTRDAYSETGLVDSDLEYGTTYYYRFFPYTDDGLVTDGSSVSATPEKITIASVPTQSGSLTYNGTEQTATFSGYDTDQMTATGITGTNAGTYTASFTPKSDYMWWDGTETAKTASWTIAKATNTITASPSSISLDTTTLYQDVTLTQTGDGVLSVVSGDTDVATVGAIENGVFRATGVDNGSTTITVSSTATENYEAGTLEIACGVQFVMIYGVAWDGSSSPAWSRTDAAANFTDPNPYYASMTDTPSSPFDNISPWKDMEIVQDANAGTLVKIPKFYYKWTRNGDAMKLQIANEQAQGFHVSPAHMDRGDGQGERDFVYVGRYHSTADSPMYTSKTNSSYQASQNISTSRTKIHQLGSEIWQFDFAMYWTIAMLYLVEYAHWKAKEKIGLCSGNPYNIQTGRTDLMPYHTGTMAQNRSTSGYGVQYRHIEEPWGVVFDFIDGAYISSDDYTSIYCMINPNNYESTTGAVKIGERSTPLSGSTASYPTTLSQNQESGLDWAMIPIGTGGGNTTYLCESFGYTANALYLSVGSNNPMTYGLFHFNTSTGGMSSIGCRLMKLPNNS